jgi:hypothetical protein
LNIYVIWKQNKNVILSRAMAQPTAMEHCLRQVDSNDLFSLRRRRRRRRRRKHSN